jgi:branched-chain amino acid transport system permease protein
VASFVAQFLNGLASASTLFLVASGLSLIFGVTRVVNFAHGSLYMVGLYVAYSAAASLGFWPALAVAAAVVALVGAAIELAVLRPVYRRPELFQLLATFAVALVVKDACLWIWGPEDLLGPRAPGLRDAVDVLGATVPSYDLFLIAVGPAVLGLLWLALRKTRWGILVRAATEDRDTAAALGVDPKRLFTSVFALGALLAGLGGALQLPREPASLSLDFAAVSDAFVVVVVGGMGSIPGAFLAALVIGEVKALCIALGTVDVLGVSVSFSKLTLVAEFVVMAIVLVLRPWGLLGAPQPEARRATAEPEPPSGPVRGNLRWAGVALLAALAAFPFLAAPYGVVLMNDVLVFALFAASLHFMMGPGGLVSFGHAAYFGLGAYGAALLVRHAGWSMEPALAAAPLVAALGAALFGWFCVRLSGIYFAMLTLAFAQIAWSIVFQWDAFTGGSNGVVGLWPPAWLSSRNAYYLLTLALCAAGVALMRRALSAPFGYALRAARDSPLRCDAIGIDVARVQWAAFIAAGAFAGLGGALYAFSKGSISPESTMALGRSVDALVMVLLGGIQSLSGPIAGAAAFTWLQDTVARSTDYWRALLGGIILLLVLALPWGIAGSLRRVFPGRRA